MHERAPDSLQHTARANGLRCGRSDADARLASPGKGADQLTLRIHDPPAAQAGFFILSQSGERPER